jgi:polyhydroxybutyrate depolymerase
MRGLLFLIAASALLGQRLEQRTITVRGVERTYWVAKPIDRGPAPATVIVFHANGGSGDAVARRSRLHLTGIARKWFVIYPNGLDKTWNSTDVEFAKAVVDAVQQSDKRIDKSKTYAAGAGSGGELAERLACEASDRFAAIAIVSAGVPEAVRTNCKPEQATPLLILTGSSQKNSETFDLWRKTLGCTGAPVTEEKNGPVAATISTAKPCRDGSEIRYVAGNTSGNNPWVEQAAIEMNQFFFRFRRLPKF